MDNTDVAALLDEIGDLLEIKGESSFKVGAYHRAAHVIRSLPQDVNELAQQGRLTEIAGVGKGIAERLQELLTKGRMTYYEELKKEVPRELVELMHIPGMGPKKAKLVYEALGITTIDELLEAVKKGKLKRLRGLGAKTEANIIRGIQQYRQQTGRLLLSQAIPAAEKIVAALKRHPAVKAISPAGSLRRWQETVGDIDILCATEQSEAVADAFCSLPDVAYVVAKGPTKSSIVLKSGLQVDLRCLKPEEFGSALQYFTGSKSHNIHLREIAKKKGLKLSEYGIFQTETNARLGGSTEEEVYRLLGLKWIDPVLRENRGEIEAAAADRLPRLVELKDIKGDLHVHTKESDGESSLKEMVEVARARGYQYLAISDHAEKLKIAHGLNVERFKKQWQAIQELNQKYADFTILTSVELNIDNEGKTDFPDEFLALFDIVTASIHTGFNQDKETLTKRALGAIYNPHIDILGHPTGRILGRRLPYQIDLESIFKAAGQTATVLELNAYPDRLDLKDDYLREAKKYGCKFAINTDAHHTGQLNYMRYGVFTARRGWLEANDIINTYEIKKVLAFLKTKQQ